ncbi:hypothetical protein MCOR09_004714 [Pyricularia oryzae]|nr:hypothetical protein MCOR09_004714 [Pyricularia oryzae]
MMSITPSTPGLTSPPHLPKQRQVRRSCNACSAQKIRCGKQHPTCKRCSVKSLRCEYSMSMRTGERPRLVVRNGEDRDRQEAGNLTPTSSGVPSPGSEALQAMATGSPASPGTQAIKEKTSFRVLAGADELSYILQSNGQLGDTATFPEFGLSGDDVDYHNHHSLFPHHDYPVQQDYTSSSGLVSGHGDGGTCQSSSQRARRTTSSNSSLRTESTGSSCVDDRDDGGSWTMGSSNKVHDCTIEALVLVANSHVSVSNCMTASNDFRSRTNAQWFCTGQDSPKEMGAVIRKNEQLLGRLGDVMDCNCSTRQEVLVLVYLAMSKAVEWYKAVLGSGGENEPTTSSSRTVGWITKTSVSIGSYSLDSDAERLVSAHLVLTQIKNHVNPLLKRLHSKVHLYPASVATPNHEHGSAWSASNLANDNADASGNLAMPSGVGRKVLEYHHNALVEELSRISERIETIKRTD